MFHIDTSMIKYPHVLSQQEIYIQAISISLSPKDKTNTHFAFTVLFFVGSLHFRKMWHEATAGSTISSKRANRCWTIHWLFYNYELFIVTLQLFASWLHNNKNHPWHVWVKEMKLCSRSQMLGIIEHTEVKAVAHHPGKLCTAESADKFVLNWRVSKVKSWGTNFTWTKLLRK